MNKPKTVQEWLDLPKDERALELAEVLTPGPWYHDWKKFGVDDVRCRKCDINYHLPIEGSTDPCSVPDHPITIDWNTAKYWQGKCEQEVYICAAIEVYETLYPGKLSLRKQVYSWLANLHKPKDARYVLIIAAMATERSKE